VRIAFAVRKIPTDVPFSTITDAYLCTVNAYIPLCTYDVSFCRTHVGCTQLCVGSLVACWWCHRTRGLVLRRISQGCVSFDQPIQRSRANHCHTSADTLYLCYSIDKDVGERHREEVFAAVGVFWIGFGTLLTTASSSNTKSNLGPQLDHNLKLRLHRNRNRRPNHARRYQVGLNTHLRLGHSVQQLSLHHSLTHRAYPNNILLPLRNLFHALFNLSSQYSQSSQMQTLILSNTNL
jgi:hypothetical protein